jgi:RNA polymerase sigma-70 factor (ECF subfamily)
MRQIQQLFGDFNVIFMIFGSSRDELTRLAARMKRKDEKAAEALYNELVKKVFGFCMNQVRRRDAAEDITSEIFLKLVSYIETYDENQDFSPWFWQLARNAVTDHFRQKRNESFGEVPEDMQSGADVERETSYRIEHSRLFDFVDGLGEDEKKLFELRFVMDLDYKEVARRTGKSEGSLRVAANRLRHKIRTHFKK